MVEIKLAPLLDASSTQTLDQWWQSDAGVSGFDLMSRAADAICHELFQHYNLKNVWVLAGGGNNGGDGWAVAAKLKTLGVNVSVWAFHDPHTLIGDAQRAFEAADGVAWFTKMSVPDVKPTVVVDALLGVGFQPPLKGAIGTFLEQHLTSCPVVAVDVPSGVSAATGAAGAHLPATSTVSFFTHKCGLVTGTGRIAAGRRVIESFGMSSRDLKRSGIQAKAQLVLNVSPLAPRSGDSFKHKNGRVFVVAGEYRMMGGALMAAKSALSCGAGLVTLLQPSDNTMLPQLSMPELMLDNLDRLSELGLSSRSDVIVVGPGWPVGQSLTALLNELSRAQISAVIDAGALRVISEEGLPSGRWVLTPHAGEAAALLGVSTSEVESNRYRSAKQIAEQYGATVILKGPGTIVSDGCDTFVIDAGSPALATAGSGDVLCGVVAACIAQGLDLQQASIASSFYHAQAGDLWERDYGSRGARATEFIPIIRAVLNGRGIHNVFSR